MTGAVEWAARVGDNWAAEWRRTDRSFAALAPALTKAVADIAPAGGHMLDIGCGAGATALALAAARGDLRITGVDLSPALIAVAQSRWAEWRGRVASAQDAGRLDFRVGDVCELNDRQRFDAMFSRHGLMFFADPLQALTALRSKLRPGGALLFTCFAERAANRWAVDPAMAIGGTVTDEGGMAGGAGPFALALRHEVAELLSQAGWSDAEAQRIDYAYRAGAGPTRAEAIADAVSFFRKIGPAASLLAAMPDDAREQALAKVHMICGTRVAAEPDPAGDGFVVDFPAAAWLWSARNRARGAAA